MFIKALVSQLSSPKFRKLVIDFTDDSDYLAMEKKLASDEWREMEMLLAKRVQVECVQFTWHTKDVGFSIEACLIKLFPVLQATGKLYFKPLPALR